MLAPKKSELDDLLQRIGMDTPALANKLRELVKLMDTIGVTDEVVPINLGVPEGFGAPVEWRTALDLNLTQAPNYTFVAGAQTWLGVPVTVSNLTNADTFAVVNGSGLVIDPNATASDLWVSANTAPKLEILFNDIVPDFVAGATRLRVWAQMAVTNCNANFEQGVFGISSSPWSSNATDRWSWSRGFNGSAVLTAQVNDGANNNQVLSTSTASNDVLMIDFFDGWTAHYYSKASSQPLTASNDDEFEPNTMAHRYSHRRSAASSTDLTAHRFSAANSLALLLAAFPVNTNNSMTVTFQRLRVEYR